MNGGRPDSQDVSSGNVNRLFKVGLIGAGDIIRATHLPVLKAIPNVDVAWITDTNEKRAKQLAKVYDVPFCELPGDLSQLPVADVYLLACPFGVRDPYYAALRERDAALYVEKPFARSSKRHAELCSWFPDFALASGLMMRCWGANILARDLIRQKIFGPLQAIRFGFGKPGIVTHGNYYFESSRGGAGMASEVGIHGIDAALFVTGATKSKILLAHTLFEGDLDVHSEARFLVQTEEGNNFELEFTVSSLQPTIEGMEISCEYATLSYPLPGQGYALIDEAINMDVTVQPKGGGAAYLIKPEHVPLYPATKFQMFYENWRNFLDGIATKTANFTSASRAQLTTDIIEDCYAANAIPETVRG